MERPFDDELLRTLMVEAEATVNSRPLIQTDESVEPLTPAKLLTLKATTVMPPPGLFVREDLYCHKRWRRVQYLAEEFWQRWRREYLPQLQLRQKWNKEQPNLRDDDIVLMLDDHAPRNMWLKAIVVKVLPSQDGLVCKVVIRTAAGSEYERPIHKLIYLCSSEPR